MFLSKLFAVAGLATLALGVSVTAASASPSHSSDWRPTTVTTTSYDNNGWYCPEGNQWGSEGSQWGDSRWGRGYSDEHGILPWSCFPVYPPRPHCVTQTVSMWYEHGKLVTDAMVTVGEHLKLNGVTYTVLTDHNGPGGLYTVTLFPSVPWWLHGGILDFKSSLCVLR